MPLSTKSIPSRPVSTKKRTSYSLAKTPAQLSNAPGTMTSMPYPKPLTARDIAAHTPALKKIPARTARVTGLLAIAVLAAMLAGCASQAPDISLIPTQTDAVTSQDGLFVQPVKWERTKPDCRGDCPRLSVDSVVFPGVQRLTDLVDHALAMMTGVGEQRVP